MVGQLVGLVELHVAVLAEEHWRDPMRIFLVAHEVGHLVEAVVTDFTSVGSLICVDVEMVLEVVLLVEALVADGADEWLSPRVDPAV